MKEVGRKCQETEEGSISCVYPHFLISNIMQKRDCKYLLSLIFSAF